MSSRATSTVVTSNTTYAVLKDEFGEYLAQSGKTSQIKNHNTTIKTWLQTLELTETSVVSDELVGNFEIKLKNYQDAQQQAGIKLSTYRSRLSHLRSVANFYQLRFKSNNTTKTFHETLLSAIKYAGYKSPYTFHRNCVGDICGQTSVVNWCNGSIIPSSKSLSIIREFELRLNLEVGILTSLIPRNLSWSKRKQESGLTSIGRKIQNSKKRPYYFWSLSLEEEWRGVVQFMTAAYLPQDKRRNSVWTYSEGNKEPCVPTAEKIKGHLRAFFGFCCLPKSNDPFLNGLGMLPEQMTMGLLADKKLAEMYLEFQKVRAGGIYTKGTLSFIGHAAQLIRPGTGYLYQHPELSRRINKRMPYRTWWKTCAETHARLTNIGSQLQRQGLIAKGRDPEEPIRDILAQDRPLHALLDMIKHMKRDLLSISKSNSRRQALHYRNILLVGLMASNPLRLRHFPIMQFDRHLKRKSNGEWWLQFKREEFKNRHALKCDYSVRVERHLWPIIERYKSEFRPRLAGADECNYVFRHDPKVRTLNRVQPISTGTLFILLQGLTYAYISGSSGFGPHAFRHIVATDIIKRNPEFGYYLAAIALHDKLDTVKQSYAHLKTHEYFEPVNRHFADAWKDVIGEEEEL